MNDQTLLTTLQSMEFLEGLKPAQVERLAGMAQWTSFGQDETIFREGDDDDLLYLIAEGQVAVEIHVPSRGRVTILTVGPGQLLGWSSLFKSQHKTATGRTTAPTQAIAFSAAQITSLCREDHELGCAILWRVAEVIAGRLRATRMQLLDIFAHSPG